MSESEILIQPHGRLANQMFQMMIALQIQKRAGKGRILGYDMPEWKLVSPPVQKRPRRAVVLRNHIFDLDNAAFMLKSGLMDTIIVNGWGMRMPYFGSPVPYRNLFQTSQSGDAVADDELLIHIRGEDILSGWHHHYFPMPFSFYEEVINLTGLRPVFMGQIGADNYSVALRRRFPEARYLPLRTIIADFTTIRSAANVVLSVSSFSWLAAWLSQKAVNIHLPVAGLFDPMNRETSLLPAGDNRYTFYKLSMPDPEARKRLNFMEWAETHPFEGILEADNIRQLFVSLMGGRQIRSTNVSNRSPS